MLSLACVVVFWVVFGFVVVRVFVVAGSCLCLFVSVLLLLACDWCCLVVILVVYLYAVLFG